MKKYILKAWLIGALLAQSYAFAEDKHDHQSEKNLKSGNSKHGDHESESKEEDHKDEHKHSEGESKEHGEKDEHGEKGGHASHGEEEENPQVGPNKGILAASEVEGIKLSPEAEKNFEIKKIKLSSADTHEIPKEAIVTAGLEINIYRYRSGFYRRIDFAQIGRSGSNISIRSKDLKGGDEIAISGLGFLRIAEIAAFGGAPEGHSH